MRILVWHVHGSYLTALLGGPHTYLIPTLADRSKYGKGRADSWDWPDNAVEVGPEEAKTAAVDLVLLQRPEELDLAQLWLGGRKPGRDVPCVYLEHNTPRGAIVTGPGIPSRLDFIHPFTNRDDVTIVHVTNFNDLYWDTGSTQTTVVQHGVVDPDYQYSGEIDRGSVVINEPLRRGRIVGTDIAQTIEARSGTTLDWFGFDTRALGGRDVHQGELHSLIAARRFFLHPHRWTSLGLSLIEAMMLGIPVLALAVTEVGDVIPKDAAVISINVDVLSEAARHLTNDHQAAIELGQKGREAALRQFGLQRFLNDWDAVFDRAVSR